MMLTPPALEILVVLTLERVGVALLPPADTSVIRRTAAPAEEEPSPTDKSVPPTEAVEAVNAVGRGLLVTVTSTVEVLKVPKVGRVVKEVGTVNEVVDTERTLLEVVVVLLPPELL